MPDFETTLRGLLEKVKHGDPAERFVADANLIRELRNHAEAILRLIEATEAQNRMWHSPIVTEALAALDATSDPAP